MWIVLKTSIQTHIQFSHENFYSKWQETYKVLDLGSNIEIIKNLYGFQTYFWQLQTNLYQLFEKFYDPEQMTIWVRDQFESFGFQYC